MDRTSQRDPRGRPGKLSPLANIHEMPGDSRRRCHSGADEVGAPAATLTTLEVAVAGGGAAFTLGELVAVHGDTHTATRLAPLETGIAEDIGQAFFFGHAAHVGGAGHHQRSHRWRDMFAFDVACGEAQVFEARIGAGADKDGIYGDIGDLLARRETHVVQGAFDGSARLRVVLLLRVGNGTGNVGYHARVGSPRNLRPQVIDVDFMNRIEARVGIAGKLSPRDYSLL